MKNTTKYTLIILLGIVIGMILMNWLKNDFLEFTISNAVVLAIVLLGFLIINFLLAAGKRSKNDAPHALGLPAGSVRAILALTLVVLFVLMALYFYLDIEPGNPKKEFAEKILTILGTLVVAVSAFYFGAKATQQGSEIAQKIFYKANTGLGTPVPVPVTIIQEALTKNKEIWIKKFNCSDIKVGKKESDQTQHELNCLVFIVASKKNQDDAQQEIPKNIVYNSNGVEYSIPTDVQVDGQLIGKNSFTKLPVEKQKEIINEFIKIEATNLKKKYPEIQGMSARPKKTEGLKNDFYCLHIDVIRKIKNLEKEGLIPTYFIFKFDNKDYRISTDITGVGENKINLLTGDGENPKQLGVSCSRQNYEECGTIGLKVYKQGIPYLLSCYHVLCAPELNAGVSVFDGSSNSMIISPGKGDGNKLKVIAEVTEGYLNNFLDVAIAKLKNDTILENSFYGDHGFPSGTLSLTSSHAKNEIGVRLVGRSSGVKYGKLIDNFQAVVYMKGYPDGTLRNNEFWNLIVTEKISKAGDSGSAVVDNENKVIGLLVGSNNLHSFIIPIDTIINRLKLDDKF